jgi:hypothetical protein
MKIEIGKLYVSRHTETRDGTPIEFELVLFATGSDVKPRWGNYDTISGVVVKNTDPFSDHQVGNFSHTWNAQQFEEYDKEVVISNQTWIKQKEIGNCCGN